MQVCPELDIAPHRTASAAAEISASTSMIAASDPPHSSTTGTMRSAQLAATFFAVLVDPVKATLSTALCVSATPVAGPPVTTKNTLASLATSLNVSPSQ